MCHYRDTLASRVKNLPALPDVLFNINALMANDDASMDAVVALLKTDAALSIRLLRVVNSPFYARQKPVADLLQATVLLGATEISNMARCLAMIDASSTIQAWSLLDSAKYWQANMAVSAIADLLAAEIGLQEKVGFIACLSNVGICALADSFADEYRDVLTEQAVLEVAEQRRFGLDNIEAANMLLAHWDITDNITADGKAADPRIAKIIDVAKLLAELLAYSSCSRFVSLQDPYQLLASIGFSEEQVSQLVPAIKNAADIGAYSAGGKIVDDTCDQQLLAYIETDNKAVNAGLSFILASFNIATTEFSQKADFSIHAQAAINLSEQQANISSIDSSQSPLSKVDSLNISEFIISTKSDSIAVNWAQISKLIQHKLAQVSLAKQQPNTDTKAV